MQATAIAQSKQKPHTSVCIKPSLFGAVLLIACLTVFSSTDLLAATYYVSPTGSDSNPGTQSAPWRTWQKSASTMVAGDTTLVMDGIYVLPEINFPNSGTAGNYITFKAQNQHQAILRSTSCNMGISVRGSYIIIENIRISMQPGTTCGSGTSRTALRLWQQGALPTPSNPSTGWAHNIVRGTMLDEMTSLNTGYKTNQDDTLFENNLVHMGIDSFDNVGTIIRNNEVWTTVPGGSQGSGIGTKGGTRNNQIYNNIIHRQGDDIALICGGSSSPGLLWDNNTGYEAYNCAAYNNVIINEGSTANSAECLGSYGATNSKLFNNVLIGCGFYSNVGGQSGGTQPLPSNITWVNNIIVCSGPTGTGPAIGGYHGSAGTTVLDYNNFFGCTGVPPQAHPITGNPQFVNPQSDWHLSLGSPSIGSGVPVSFTGFSGGLIDVTKDADGVPRIIPWSLGRYRSVGTTDITPPLAPAGLIVN